MKRYPKRPTGDCRKDIEELYSYLFQEAERENRESKEAVGGTAFLSEEDIKKLKKLIGGK